MPPLPYTDPAARIAFYAAFGVLVVLESSIRLLLEEPYRRFAASRSRLVPGLS